MTRRLAVGVDGCRAGWLGTVLDVSTAAFAEVWVAPSFSEVMTRTASCESVAIDIPIGVPDRMPAGGRACEVEARKLLGPLKSSVFSTPPRVVLDAADYDRAVELCRANSDSGKGLSKQSFAIISKIREVDAGMTPALQDRIVETHPELCFRSLNGDRPLSHGKKTGAGAVMRFALLENAGLRDAVSRAAETAGSKALWDDVLDSVVAAWTAAQKARGEAKRVPDWPEVDGRGLRMEMWF